MQENKQESLDKSTRHFINARIRDFCEEKKIKQADLERIGINKSTVSMVWKDKQLPGLEFIQKMAIEFKILNIHWLLTGEGNMLKTYEKPKKKYDENGEMMIIEEPGIKCPLCQTKDKLILSYEKQIELLEFSLGKNRRNGSE